MTDITKARALVDAMGLPEPALANASWIGGEIMYYYTAEQVRECMAQALVRNWPQGQAVAWKVIGDGATRCVFFEEDATYLTERGCTIVPLYTRRRLTVLADKLEACAAAAPAAGADAAICPVCEGTREYVQPCPGCTEKYAGTPLPAGVGTDPVAWRFVTTRGAASMWNDISAKPGYYSPDGFVEGAPPSNLTIEYAYAQPIPAGVVVDADLDRNVVRALRALEQHEWVTPDGGAMLATGDIASTIRALTAALGETK